ncbi:hypothetical protein ASE67_09250 [Sphingomonas sp. Leaf23]|uniref:hypothetical protein n=1 Tax=Sphingomonas sp. Leaf23 TaxID=1735689 RepID=UPI0006FF11FE|nr:hypothetical protein [Sphingomonas sp. Leaf23]KQM86047.1 hypothetical protein ASE67_09250 [Sphingomonas sp. Leaf23]
MTAAQAMQMIAWNDRRAKGLAEPDLAPKRGESNAAYLERKAKDYRAGLLLAEEEMRMVEYAQLEWRRGGRRTQWEPGGWEVALEIALRKE